jgi:hypothetical protein
MTDVAPEGTSPDNVWLERLSEGPPLARISWWLHPAGVYGTGPDDSLAIEDLIDELELWGGDSNYELADVYLHIRHLTRAQQRRWLLGLPRRAGGDR